MAAKKVIFQFFLDFTTKSPNRLQLGLGWPENKSHLALKVSLVMASTTKSQNRPQLGLWLPMTKTLLALKVSWVMASIHKRNIQIGDLTYSHFCSDFSCTITQKPQFCKMVYQNEVLPCIGFFLFRDTRQLSN